MKKLLLFAAALAISISLSSQPARQAAGTGCSSTLSAADPGPAEISNRLVVEFWFYGNENKEAEVPVNSTAPGAPHRNCVIHSETSVSINEQMLSEKHLTSPLAFNPGLPGEYSLVARNPWNIDNTFSIGLEDIKLGKTVDLRDNPVYNFTYDPWNDDGRFVLHFDSSPAGESESQPVSGLQIYTYQNMLCIKTAGTTGRNGTVAVYDLVGTEVFSAALSDNPLNRFRLMLNEGYYIVKVVTGANVHAQKVLFGK
jgi:hypothetical protein